MVLCVSVPYRDGVCQRHATIFRARRTRSDTGWLGAFDLEISGVGLLRGARLCQYNTGGFFTTGNPRPTPGNHRYFRPFDFEEPFRTLLAIQSRAEIAQWLYENEGGLFRERDELMELDENEQLERCEPLPLLFDESLRIELKDERAPYELRARFDAVIGGAIRIRALRLTGDIRSPRLVVPSSDHLRDRPVELDPWIQSEIVRRRMLSWGDGPGTVVA